MNPESIPQPAFRVRNESARVGTWRGPTLPTGQSANDICDLLRDCNAPIFVVRTPDGFSLTKSGKANAGTTDSGEFPAVAYAPPAGPTQLGDPEFCSDYNVRMAYVAGAMANGIASVDLVEAMAREGLLAFFGSAGLSVNRVTESICELKRRLPNGEPFGCNLIHSPNEPHTENAVVDLLIAEDIRLVEASAYLRLTLPVVRYRVHGIHRDADGRIVTPNRIIAKVSRVEVATRFLSPPPDDMLSELVSTGAITAEQAELAAQIPVAQDLTAEADSGGHTDNRPAIALFPTMLALRDRMQQTHGYASPIRVGLAGGISTPASAAAAFAMGAAFVLTGSVNQACVESGTSDTVRTMLAEAEQADTAMCPAADMFEMGVQVQVLKRGTMFPMRGAKLYEHYRQYKSMDEIPPVDREKLEKTVFRAPLEDVWKQTEQFFAERDPRQNERAARDPRHKMALVFRWYLGQSSNWANTGVADRKMDYQVWCGPAMGAFNEWVRGTYLEEVSNRRTSVVANEIMQGAALLQRVNMLRAQGIEFAPEVIDVRPGFAAHTETQPTAERASA